MVGQKIDVTLGFESEERAEIARIFWDGLGEKMERVLGQRSVGQGFIEDAMDPACVFVAKSEGRVIGMAGIKHPNCGFCHMRFEPLRQNYSLVGAIVRWVLGKFDAPRSKDGEMEIDALSVDTSYRSHGVGALLTEACVQDARNRGLERIVLTVLENNTRARAFYLREGFHEVAVKSMGLAGRLFGIDKVVLMHRAL